MSDFPLLKNCNFYYDYLIFSLLVSTHVQGPNAPSLPSQIELILITARPPASVRALVEQITNHLDLRHLRKISAVCVSDPTSASLVLQSAATTTSSGGQGTSGDYGSGGQIEMSQQFGCGSPSELSKHKLTSNYDRAVGAGQAGQAMA